MPTIAVMAERENEMPRETIRLNDRDNGFDVKVGWSKDTFMQVGIEDKESRSLFWILLENSAEYIGQQIKELQIDNKTDEELGHNILNILDCATHGPVSSLWTSPSRHEVNDLIRLLRRARDSAFGRDE